MDADHDDPWTSVKRADTRQIPPTGANRSGVEGRIEAVGVPSARWLCGAAAEPPVRQAVWMIQAVQVNSFQRGSANKVGVLTSQFVTSVSPGMIGRSCYSLFPGENAPR
jgi:hypothetical protein